MKIICLLCAMLIPSMGLAQTPADPLPVTGQVDTADYVKDAVDTVNAYVQDVDMAMFEQKEIEQCERDVYELTIPMPTTVTERRKKLNDDLAILYDLYQWLLGVALI